MTHTKIKKGFWDGFAGSKFQTKLQKAARRKDVQTRKEVTKWMNDLEKLRRKFHDHFWLIYGDYPLTTLPAKDISVLLEDLNPAWGHIEKAAEIMRESKKKYEKSA
jgi:hypothetical protein